MRFLDQTIDGLRDGVVARWERHRDLESLVGLFIMTFWVVLTGQGEGPILVLLLVAVGWFLHGAAIESGSHAVLWLATSTLLVFIVIAIEVTVGGVPPVAMVMAGTTALAHNELVRINYARRRDAIIGEDVFLASTIGVAAAGLIGVAGTVLLQILGSGSDRSWLWMPAAVIGLMVLGFGLAMGPARRADSASKERWIPGGRIPPQPLSTDETERF